MIIKILGSGCKKCNKLEKRVKKVLLMNDLTAQVIKVNDILEISKYNLLKTPGLVINEIVVSSGLLLEDEEILQLIKSHK